MRKIIWECGCGHREYEYVEGEGEELRPCELDCCPDGNYKKSKYWDHAKDKEDERRVREGQAVQKAYENVVPMDKTKQGKKGRGKRATR